MLSNSAPLRSAAPLRALLLAAPALRHPLTALANATAIARQRRQLARLDADRLEDLGLSRHEAQREATRPFWDAPKHWTA